MSDFILGFTLIAIPITYVIVKFKHDSDKRYLKKFNETYHMDNASNKYAREFLRIGKFPFHAFAEKDINKGIEMEMKYLREQDQYLNSLSIEEHSQLIRGLDSYLTGDISNIRKAKKIARERGYQIK